jgi:hypothetical protein
MNPSILSAALFRLAIGAALILLGAGLIPAPASLIALLACGAIDVLILWGFWEAGRESVNARAPAPSGDSGKPVPGPVPRVAPAPAPILTRKPRNTGITTTEFGGRRDPNTSAYDNHVIDDTELAAALPARIPNPRGKIRVFYQGATCDCDIGDVGPWNTNDPYWTTGSRPQAESGTDLHGRSTNLAGLDLSPGVWAKLGHPGTGKAKTDWDWVSYLNADTSKLPVGPNIPAPPAPPVASGGTPPWLALARSLIGTHATHDNAVIMAWPAAIAAKFPDMADYCKGYVHDSIPWCGLTVAYLMAMSGIRPMFGAGDTDKFLWAFAWQNFGTPVTGDPQPGDVLVFRWAGGGGHVTLYDHEVNDNYYHCTGGNQGSGHVVSTESMPMGNCIAIRRPPNAAVS